MTIAQYLETLPPEEQVLINSYRNLVLATDKTVTEELGKMMSIEHAFVYKQEKAFKYGITRTKNHFSFHCMVMYGFPKMIEALKPKLKNVVFQKGCINFKSIEDFPLDVFESCMKTWASVDYMAVLRKYNKIK